MSASLPGTLNPNAKLDDSAVRMLRSARRAGATLGELAALFNVSKQCVWLATTRCSRWRTWRHVEDAPCRKDLAA